MSCRPGLFALSFAWLALLLGPAWARAADGVPTVDPEEITKHPDWVGRTIAVDARVKFILRPREGETFAELILKRGRVAFRLPPNLRPDRPEDVRVVRAQGVLRKDGDDWYCDTTALTVLPRDEERLEQGVAALSPDDFKGRAAWARWAERRANEYDKGTGSLAERGRELEAEAVRIEADRTTLPPDERPALWLRLARRARERQLPEPEPSALAHKAFRARLRAGRSAAELEALRGEVETFFPRAQTPTPADLSNWLDRYQADPADAYRQAPEEVRRGLDRRLLADLIEKLITLREADRAGDPAALRALAEQARLQLPDRPKVAERLEQRGLEGASNAAPTLRKDEMEAVAKAWEARGQDDRARRVRQEWLDEQRRRLSPTDAEGRLILARQYDALLHDDEAFVALNREALKIDPHYGEAEKALKSKGYRKVDDGWVKSESGRARSRDDDQADEGPPPGEGGTLRRGLTPSQVQARMGKPDRVTRSATQGQVLEQWIYRTPRSTHYINFVRRANQTQPVVEAHFTLTGEPGAGD